MRTGDLVARLGGDELALVLWDATADGAVRTCERIVERIHALERSYPGTGIGASVGVAHFTSAPRELDEVMHAADAAMYEAKRGGKGRVVLRAVEPTSPALPST